MYPISGKIVALVLGLGTAATAWSTTPDKSGVKPSAISLPSGAGSIEGLGESFKPQLNTGSSSDGVAIAVPPGRAGLQPKVRLAYNSGLGNSFVGLGWSLEFPSIKRQTDKGFPSYTAADVFVFQGEELVPLSNPEGDWRCENESAFQRFRQIDTDGDFAPDAWEMTERNGTRHLFGQLRGLAGRWSVVIHPNPPAGALTLFDRTYCWALNATTDLRGLFLRGVSDSPTAGPAGHDQDRNQRSEIKPGGNAGNKVGSFQPDAVQGHRHDFWIGSWGIQTGNFDNNWLVFANNFGSRGDSYVRDAVSDGVNGPPRTTVETRPKNAYVNYSIKY